jgi:DNA-binding beta-propeller fold protein YncE
MIIRVIPPTISKFRPPKIFVAVICASLVIFLAATYASAAYVYVSTLAGPGAGNDQFLNPVGVAIATSSGNIYVTDSVANGVLKFNATDTYVTRWGTSGSGDGNFNRPFGIAVDAAENVYVVDSLNARVEKFSSSGVFLTKWGSQGSADGQFYAPAGIAIDVSTGAVYVSESGNHRIQKFDSSGNFLTKWGSFGSADGQFRAPIGLAVDSAGNVYVGDDGNYRIQKFNSSGTFLSKFGSFGYGDGRFSFLMYLAVDGHDNIYVGDPEYSPHIDRIQKFNSDGTYITQFGSYGSGNGQFNSVEGMAVNAAGYVYAADYNNRRVQKFIGSPLPVVSTSDASAVTPTGATMHGTIIDLGSTTPTVRGFAYGTTTAYGATTTEIGSFGTGAFSAAVGGLNTLTTVYHFRSYATNADGTAFGADFTITAGPYLAAKVMGQADFLTPTVNRGDPGGNPHANSLWTPYGLAVDETNHKLYAADSSNHRVLRYDLNADDTVSTDTPTVLLGQSSFTARVFGGGQGQFDTPQDVALDTALNRLYVDDNGNNRILVFDTSGLGIGTLSTHVLGQPGYLTNDCNQGALASTTMCSPTGIAVDPTTHYLYVSDGNSNNRVLVFDLSGGITDGMAAKYVIGQTDFTSTNCDTTQSTICGPYGGVAVDAVHHILYVNDIYNNNRVMVFDLNNLATGMNAMAVIGQTDFVSADTSGPTASLLGYGFDGNIAVDPVAQLVYVVDDTANRIMVFDATKIDNRVPVNGEAAKFVFGQPDFVSSSAATFVSTQSSLRSPEGVAFAASSSLLYVADYAENRILEFQLINIGTTSLPAGMTNTPYNSPVSMLYDQGTPSLSVASGTLPAGLSLGGGTISGTPTAAGTFNFTLKSSDDKLGEGVIYTIHNRSITIASSSVPTASTTAASSVGTTTATLNGSIDAAGSSAPIIRGFVYGAGIYYDSTTTDSGIFGTGSFSATTTFACGTAYHYAAYASNIIGTGYGSDRSFSTLSCPVGTGPPTVSTAAASGVATTSSTLNGSISAVGGSAPTVRGFVYGGDIYYGATTTEAGSFSTGAFSTSTVVFACGTLYHYAAYATNASGSGYGGDQFFTTLSCPVGSGPPAVSVQAASSVTATDAALNGTIVSDNGASSTARGFIYGTASGSYTATSTDPSASPYSLGAFSLSVTGSTCNSGYYYKSYAANSFGTAYSPTEAYFVTSACSGGGGTYDGGARSYHGGSYGYTTPLPNPPGCPPGDFCPFPNLLPGGGYPDIPPPGISIPLTTVPEATPGIPTTPAIPGNPQIPTVPATPAVPGETIPREPPPGRIPSGPPILDDAITAMRETLDTVPGVVVTDTALLVSLIIGALLSASALFGDTLFKGVAMSLTDVAAIPSRAWNLIALAVGWKKRQSPWGVIYDSVTKRPLDPAYVEVKDAAGTTVADVFTDIDGRYGFILPPGTYTMTAGKTNYTFPSAKLAGKTRDELYNDLYFGEPFTVRAKDDVIERNLPLDPIAFDWNEFAKVEQHLMKLYAKRDHFWNRLSGGIFVAGLIYAVLITAVKPSAFNIIIMALYAVLLIVRMLGLKPHSYGTITDSAGDPLSYGIIHVKTAQSETEIGRAIADQYGRYFCLVADGRYVFTIDRKNTDGSYSEVMKTPVIRAKGGIIKRNFMI